ncbi:MAG: ABC transporter permease [Gemmatimonadaceae bacterium]
MSDGRQHPLLGGMSQDVRYALRSLRRSRGFTLIAVATLALGIGAATAMFGVLNGVLLRQLPVDEPDELVVLWLEAPERASDHLPLSYLELTTFGEQTRTFHSVAGVLYQGAHEKVYLDRGRPVTLSTAWVTGDFLPLLGVAPVLGRTLLPADDVPGAAPVMVISHGLWQRHFGGQPSAVGHSFEWDGRQFTVVGVMPRGFEYPEGAEAWTPVLPEFPATIETGADLAARAVFDIVGRLRPGVGTREASADYDAFLRSTDAERPAAARGMKPVVTPLAEVIVGDARATLWTATAAVGLLLLIACVNVANLLLIRGSARALVIAQLSLAILVVAGAGLLTRSLMALQGVEMGFDDERLLVVKTILPPDLLPERHQQVALQEEMLARVAAIPGVASAAAMPSAPFSGQGGWSAMYTGEGQTAELQASNPWVNFEVVGPEYFGTLGIPLRRGRAIGEQDREGAPPVAVVSEAVARHSWPGEDPIGRRIKLGPLEGRGEWHTVVGVVGETRYHELTSPEPSLYLPIRQFGGPVPMTLAVRTRADPALVMPLIGQALRQVHPELMVAGGGSMSQLMAAPLARPRFSTILLATFAAITLLLAAVGIYGVMAATVRQRTREIGIRLALGARMEEVRALVLRQGMLLALAGCAIGIAAALAGTRALRSMLFEVSPTDPPTLAAVALLIMGVAALACYVPARRASRVDPVTALRAE